MEKAQISMKISLLLPLDAFIDGKKVQPAPLQSFSMVSEYRICLILDLAVINEFWIMNFS
jgi:hypothetical protein